MQAAAAPAVAMVQSPGLFAAKMLPYSCCSQSSGESQDNPINQSASERASCPPDDSQRGCARSAQPIDGFTEQQVEKPDMVS